VNRNETVTSWQRSLIVLLGLLAFAFWGCAVVVNQSYFFVAMGTTVLVISLLPILFSREYDWFCPWSALILSVIYGCTLPAACISFGLPSHEVVRENILLNQPVEYFVLPSMLVAVFVVCMGAGFFLVPVKKTTLPINRVCSPQRLLVVCGICAVVSFVAFGAYVMANGGLSSGFSSKRGTIRTLDVGADKDFSQLGWLRHFAKLGNIGLLLLVAYWSRFHASTWSVGGILRFVILGGLILVSIAFPFYSSSRAGMMWVIICFFGCLYYMGQKVINFRTVTVGALFLGLLLFVTLVRNSASDSHDSVSKKFGHLLLNRHGPDLAVTSHVVQNIPKKLEFQYGKTIAVWLLAPIPREILPNKPLIHSGPIIGQRIYKLNVSGVPPGTAAELYWNFHIPGVVFGSLLMGIALRLTYQFFRNLQVDSILVVPIYIFAVFPCAFKAATHSIGPAFVIPIVDLVTVLCVVYAVSIVKPGLAPSIGSILDFDLYLNGGWSRTGATANLGHAQRVMPIAHTDVVEMAIYYDVDPVEETWLLQTVRQAVLAPLPRMYKEMKDSSGERYYYNTFTDESQRDHPLDDYFRQRIAVEREEVASADEAWEVFFWQVFFSDDGTPYFHNFATGEEFLEAPDGMSQQQVREQIRIDAQSRVVDLLSKPRRAADLSSMIAKNELRPGF